MKKIRINELARELEVKPNKILELLPDLGVTEKKTHSSSIDEDVAIQVKRHFDGGGSGDYSFSSEHYTSDELSERSPRDHNSAVAVEEPPEDTEDIHAEEEPESPTPAAPAVNAAPASPMSNVPPAQVAPGPSRPAAPGTPALPAQPASGTQAGTPAPATPEPPASSRPASMPLRPPLAGSGPGSGPREPMPAPPAPQAPRPVAATQAPPPSPGAPRPPAPTLQRNAPIYRPGQVISGPRQPLPPGVVTEPPRAPAPPGPPRPAPSRPAPTIAVPRPAGPGPAQPPHPQAHQQGPGGPQQNRPVLAGQPVARPVVPPRPDLVARLQQSKAPAPGAPRPGMPAARSAPVPGQPIYRGPIRPGQPLVPRPGGPGAPAGPGARMRRPMHPTSPLRPEQATPIPETQRRLQGKPAARQVQRDRDREREDKSFRQPVRREQADSMLAAGKEITVTEGITVKDLSEKLGIKANLVIKKLVDRKIFATINQNLEAKLAEDIAKDFGAVPTQMSFEDEATMEVVMGEDSRELLVRAPVVTIMGHVDHGKTSLLDALRETNVAEREAGGITQHIGAYQIVNNGRKVVFIDTPGHEAFTRMRARGAKVTDIVILVVSADDGVMPQTLEAIDHARAAKVPIIVAINKIDKPDAQPDRIKQQLADRGLLAEDWGGDTVMVPVSAKTKQNLELLLEMIALVAEIGNYRANANRPAVGTVLEAKLDKGRGPVATVLVQNGTLRVGDFFICGQVFGKVRALFSDTGASVKDAEPSTPVEVLGLADLPEVGDSFQVVTDTAKAKQIVLYREGKSREQAMSKGSRITLEQLHQQAKEGDLKDLNVIIKADVGGSAEVLAEMLQKLSTEKIKVRVISKGVGAITEGDVLLATASNGIIIGFNVRPERQASAVAEREKVDIRLHTIIYELTDEIKKAMEGLLDPVFQEVFRGRATVQEVFRISKVGVVAGCLVNEGTLTRDSQVRILRDNIVIHTGRIESLRRFKNDVSEVKSGFECGVTIANFSDIKQSDVFEAFAMEKIAQTI